MNITDKHIEGLVHTYRGEVAADVLQAEEDRWLKDYGATVKIDGFRPGKATLPVLRQKYGERAQQEAIEKLISKKCQELIKESNINISGKPQITNLKKSDAKVEFELRLEQLPEIPEISLEKLAVEKAQLKVSEEEINQNIDSFLKARALTAPVTKARAFKEGDTLVIDFEGHIPGIPKENTCAKDFQLLLGANVVYPDFEKPLLKAKVGDTVEVRFSFDKDLHDKKLAGQPAEFTVQVKEHREAADVKLTDEIAKDFGFGALKEMRDYFEQTIDQMNQTHNFLYQKRQVLDYLADKYQFDCPPSLIEQELDAIMHEVKHELDNHEHGPNCNHSDDELDREQYREISYRRVRLGLILAHLGNANKITVTPQELSERVTQEAMRYPGQEKQVMEFYRNNANALMQLRAPIFEDKVVEYILSQAKITEKPLSREAIIKKLEVLDKVGESS